MTIPARYTLTEAHFRIAELEKQCDRLIEQLDAAGAENARLQQALDAKRKEELIDGIVRFADDLEAGVIFVQDFPPPLIRRFREALAETDTPACDHEWVDARNSAVESGELCIKCHALRATAKCTECGRELHGYRGPRCRYCDGTAE